LHAIVQMNCVSFEKCVQTHDLAKLGPKVPFRSTPYFVDTSSIAALFFGPESEGEVEEEP